MSGGRSRSRRAHASPSSCLPSISDSRTAIFEMDPKHWARAPALSEIPAETSPPIPSPHSRWQEPDERAPASGPFRLPAPPVRWRGRDTWDLRSTREKKSGRPSGPAPTRSRDRVSVRPGVIRSRGRFCWRSREAEHQGLQVDLIRLGIRRSAAARRFSFGRGQGRLQRLRDAQRDITLNREHIVQPAVVLFAPECLLGFGIDEFDRHPDTRSLESDAAFDGAARSEICSQACTLASPYR